MNRWKTSIKGNTIYFIVSFFVFLILMYKSATMSMTHDESASFFYLNDVSIWGHLFDAQAWPNANNHWLNTILFQFSTRIFSIHDWSIRLPNVFSFLVYSYYFIKLLEKVNEAHLRFLGFTVALLNPYLLDFFTVARGYGLGLAFSKAALYHVYNYIINRKNSDIARGSFAFSIASLSLFSYFSLYLAVIGTLLLF
ncbi:MAG TPA: hypothetical protein PKD85_16400, partial [Saprospiraceae bacterium]|nr:hypothetical protein [Saprospiraceae bacterium]